MKLAGMTRFSRPVAKRGHAPGPFQHRPNRVAIKGVVFIGQHDPGTHWAPVAQQFVPANELYDNRRR